MLLEPLQCQEYKIMVQINKYMKEKEPWRDVRALFSGMRLRLWNFIKNMRILRIYMEFLYV